MEETFRPVIGIDLGTTNSAAAYISRKKPVMIPLQYGERTMPSVVLKPRSGRIIAGEDARSSLVAMPGRTKAAVKRDMGSEKEIRLGDETYSPEEVSAFILKEIKYYADQELGQGEKEAVITVPAYFTNEQREATKKAGELAGFTVDRIINEPTAAALAYGMNHNDKDGHILVYDLGGGTFDVSIVEIMDGIMEVKASAGNHELGGEDFDWLLVDWLSQHLILSHGIDPRDDDRSRARLKDEAEKIKKQLSYEETVEISIPVVTVKDDTPLGIETTLKRADFIKMIDGLLLETKDKVTDVLKESQLEPADIDDVLLVGGSTRIPYISEMMTEFFRKKPLNDVNPDEAVAMGAAVQAGIKSGALGNDGLIVTDVAPFSIGDFRLGVNGRPGAYQPIIDRNMTIPVTRSEMFSTTVDNQTAVKIEIYQGEEKWVSKNYYLNEFVLEGLPKAPAGMESVEVTFRYNLNGILEVTAKNPSTDKEMKVTLNDGIDRHSQSAFEDSLAKIESAFNPDKKDEELDLFDFMEDESSENEIDEEARVWITRLKEGLADTDSEDRENQIEGMISKLESALASGEPSEINDAVEEAIDLSIDLEI